MVTTKDGNKTANCEVTVSALPAGAMPGVFSVSDDYGTTVKKIHFSKGNLYYDSSLFKFEDYTDENFPQDCVFLPAAGCRNGSSVDYVGDNGYYWSSSAYDIHQVCSVLFGRILVDLNDRESRNHGSNVRLITECQ